MAFYFNAQQQQQPSHMTSHNNHHGGRSRRQPRLSSQNSHRPFRGVRSMKELTEVPTFSVFRSKFEACKGFELDDDLEFCPGLLTEDDVRIDLFPTKSFLIDFQLQSISSSSSDRSSLSSGSPHGSPIQQAIQPAQVSPPFASLTPYPSYGQQTRSQPSSVKIHQPSAMRTRSAIPIVDPNTMQRVASPPTSISPSRMQQQSYMRRGW